MDPARADHMSGFGFRQSSACYRPTYMGVPRPGIAIFSRDFDIRRAWNAFEILHSPGISFTNRHVRLVLSMFITTYAESIPYP